MRRMVVIACGAVLSLAGCASTRSLSGETSGRASPDEPLCRVEPQTGSHVPREVCRTEAQEEQEHERARELILLGQQRGEIIIR